MAVDFDEQMYRKKRALDSKLAWLREQGEDSPAARNSMIASNEVAWELGVFEREEGSLEDPPFGTRRDGLIIRTRRDALEAKLNSAPIHDAVLRIEKKIQRVEMLAVLSAVASIGVALKLLF
jgi:hypothetical protein